MFPPLALACGLAVLAHLGRAQNLSEAQIDVVRERMAESSLKSWEIGTQAQTLLELDAPYYSVFSSTPLPPSKEVPSNTTAGAESFFEIARETVQQRERRNEGARAPLPLMPDGSAADPASIAFAVLLADWTGQDNGAIDYMGAVEDQYAFLYERAPRTSDGAISHRVGSLQLWSDSVYMVPPFFAYYGALTGNKTLVEDGYTQIKLYRNYLRDTGAGNLWKHVVLGENGIDEKHWSTGNGWAAAGMLRVLATIKHSQWSNEMKSEQTDLAKWITEIHDAMYPHLDSTSIFRNYADDKDTFYDAAGSALMASTVYRLSVLTNEHKHLPSAEKTREALFAAKNSGGASNAPLSSSARPTATSSGSASTPTATADMSNLQHFDADGWLTPVVNPHSYGIEGEKSAEGQAFVLKMIAAYNDWDAAGHEGANGNSASSVMASGLPAVLSSTLVLFVMGMF